MSPFAARLLSAERRMAELDAGLRVTLQSSRAARGALGSGAINPRPIQVPWLPRGTVPVLYRVLGPCTSAPIAGAVVTTSYAGLIVDERRTTGDGYCRFLGVQGYAYTYTVTGLPSSLRAVSGTISALGAGGANVAVNLALPSGYGCFIDCPTPIPLFAGLEGEDEYGTFTWSGGTGCRAYTGQVGNAGCTALVTGAGRIQYGLTYSTGALAIGYYRCDGVAFGYPITRTICFAGGFIATVPATLTGYTCSPFEATWTASGNGFNGGDCTKLFGADPVTITFREP